MGEKKVICFWGGGGGGKIVSLSTLLILEKKTNTRSPDQTMTTTITMAEQRKTAIQEQKKKHQKQVDEKKKRKQMQKKILKKLAERAFEGYTQRQLKNAEEKKEGTDLDSANLSNPKLGRTAVKVFQHVRTTGNFRSVVLGQLIAHHRFKGITEDDIDQFSERFQEVILEVLRPQFRLHLLDQLTRVKMNANRRLQQRAWEKQKEDAEKLRAAEKQLAETTQRVVDLESRFSTSHGLPTSKVRKIQDAMNTGAAAGES